MLEREHVPSRVEWPGVDLGAITSKNERLFAEAASPEASPVIRSAPLIATFWVQFYKPGSEDDDFDWDEDEEPTHRTGGPYRCPSKFGLGLVPQVWEQIRLLVEPA